MLKENLDRALNDIDLDSDKSAWLRFLDWISSFHELDTTKLVRLESFSKFSEVGSVELPLKYFESIRDLWIKWSKAVKADIISEPSI
jgi:hypothetical protein